MANEAESRVLHVMEPLEGAAPEVGAWLWALEEVRRGLLQLTKDLDQAALDWRGNDGQENAIGSLLYHIAIIEMSWLYDDILLEPVPDDIAELFPHPHRQSGMLSHVGEEPLDLHLRRLAITRQRFLGRMRGMTVEDWHARRSPPGEGYVVTPAWAVFHLVEHEAGHAFQVRSLRRRALAGSAS